jgi:adenosylcobinamide kinase/adenosylcobinamide-phosphate guanylyltransferase
MSQLILITGGQRSGKSSYAQEMALSLSDNPVYLATARIWDDDFNQRVNRHKNDRDSRWETIEEEKHISKLNLNNRIVVVDCITMWLTNFFHDNQYNPENTLKEAIEEWNRFVKQHNTLIVVTNETGMGLHATTESGRKFTDIQGWMNQHIAKQANKVILMISGIPLNIK